MTLLQTPPALPPYLWTIQGGLRPEEAAAIYGPHEGSAYFAGRKGRPWERATDKDALALRQGRARLTEIRAAYERAQPSPAARLWPHPSYNARGAFSVHQKGVLYRAPDNTLIPFIHSGPENAGYLSQESAAQILADLRARRAPQGTAPPTLTPDAAAAALAPQGPLGAYAPAGGYAGIGIWSRVSWEDALDALSKAALALATFQMIRRFFFGRRD